MYALYAKIGALQNDLEQELGTPLFIRSKGELSLTSAGVLYVEAAQKVVKIQKDLYQNIAG